MTVPSDRAHPSDPELVARCLAQDEGAWEQVVERYADFIYGVGRRQGLDAHEAGDLVQEVFLRLLKGLGRLRKRDRLLGWLAQTARREAWRMMRRAREERRREEAVARPEMRPERVPVHEIEVLEEVQTVREAYGAIGERCRRLLDLLFLADPRRTYAEIGAELAIPVGSIGPTRRRCLEALQRELHRLGFEDPVPAGRRDA